jgi:hypothetical protein
MNHGVDTCQRPIHSVRISHIRHHQLAVREHGMNSVDV